MKTFNLNLAVELRFCGGKGRRPIGATKGLRPLETHCLWVQGLRSWSGCLEG